MPINNGKRGKNICILLNYRGIYNAETNDPHLDNETGKRGEWLLTVVEGSNNPTGKKLVVHEMIVHNGAVWQSGGVISDTDSIKVSNKYIIIKGQKIAVGDTVTIALGKAQGQIDDINFKFTNYYTKQAVIDLLIPIAEQLKDRYTKEETEQRITDVFEPLYNDFSDFVDSYNARNFDFDSPDKSMSFNMRWNEELNRWEGTGTATGSGSESGAIEQEWTVDKAQIEATTTYNHSKRMFETSFRILSININGDITTGGSITGGKWAAIREWLAVGTDMFANRSVVTPLIDLSHDTLEKQEDGTWKRVPSKNKNATGDVIGLKDPTKNPDPKGSLQAILNALQKEIDDGGTGGGKGTMKYEGAWNKDVDYQFDLNSIVPVVIYQDKYYSAIAKPTKGKTPDQEATAWKMYSGKDGKDGTDGASVKVGDVILRLLTKGKNIDFKVNPETGEVIISATGGSGKDYGANLPLELKDDKFGMLFDKEFFEIYKPTVLDELSEEYPKETYFLKQLSENEPVEGSLTLSKDFIDALNDAFDNIETQVAAIGEVANTALSEAGEATTLAKSALDVANKAVKDVQGSETSTAVVTVETINGVKKVKVDMKNQPQPILNIPLYEFSGTITATYNKDIIPVVNTTMMKNPLPTKEISISMFVVDSFYPDKSKWFVVCLNLNSTVVKIDGVDTVVAADMFHYVRVSYDLVSPTKSLFVDLGYLQFKFDPSVIINNPELYKYNQQLISFKAQSYKEVGALEDYPNFIDNTNPGGFSWGKSNNIGTNGFITVAPQTTFIYDGRQINAGDGVAQFVINMQSNQFSTGFAKFLLFKCEATSALATSILRLTVNANTNTKIVSNRPYTVFGEKSFIFNNTITCMDKDAKRYLLVAIYCHNNNLIFDFSNF